MNQSIYNVYNMDMFINLLTSAKELQSESSIAQISAFAYVNHIL